ncbi:thioredoxin domain-containing protein [Candidatus Zinderia endosymbiont of Aphrophora alni]|uniref:thioredoxin domain-containing protein n=1 Tax=Candidatus Zinderia endosymbiont of Aphrophora alni TaxID=3077951 RepID=UPI0030D2B3F3
MNYKIFNKKKYLEIYEKLSKNKWVISCFCVEWCEICRRFQKNFYKLSKKYLKYYFFWIDIEENNDFFTNIKTDKFPKILIQYKKKIIFFSNFETNIFNIYNIIKKFKFKSQKKLNEFIKNNNIIYNWKQYNLYNYIKNKNIIFKK